jgi:ribonucleotide reductase alpha subunit
LGIRTKIRRRESRRPNEQESWVVALERSASIAEAVCAISAKYDSRDIGWVCGSVHLSSAWRDRLREAGIDTYHADAWREATNVDGSDVSLAYWLQHGKATRETAHAILTACGEPELAHAVRSCQIVREVRRTDEPETLYDLTVPGTQTYVASDPTTGSFVVVHNTGYNFSHLRPKGDLISTSGGDASGPVSFMGLFHNAMEVVHRAGKKHAAQMGILNCDHPDIMEFIQCKDQEGAYWTFNISVAVTDEFMEAVRNDDDWELKFNGKVYKTIKAKDLWDYIVQHAWHNGDPGVIFIDTVNRNNRYPELIEACNPCVTGDTRIYTRAGLIQAQELAQRQRQLDVVVDARFGVDTLQAASHVFPTGVKPVYRLSTVEGYDLRLTADHKVMTSRGWVEAQNLTEGDSIHILNRSGSFGHEGSLEAGRVLGWLVGDGYINKWETQPKAILCFWQEDIALADAFSNYVGDVVAEPVNNREYTNTPSAVAEREEVRISSTRL